MTQLAQRLGLDLTNALAGDTESLAHLLQRQLASVDEAEAELQHATFARGQGVEDVLDLERSMVNDAASDRRRRFLVLDEVAELGILLLADRGSTAKAAPWRS